MNMADGVMQGAVTERAFSLAGWVQPKERNQLSVYNLGNIVKVLPHPHPPLAHTHTHIHMPHTRTHATHMTPRVGQDVLGR